MAGLQPNIDLTPAAMERWRRDQASDAGNAMAAACQGLAHASPVLLVAHSDREQYLVVALEGLRRGHTVVFGNPAWRQREWDQAAEALPPTTIAGADAMVRLAKPFRGPALPQNLAGKLLIPTGGSSGRLRFAVHSIASLDAATAGYAQHFHHEAINCVCPLPVCHIAGWMCAWRSLRTGGWLALVDPREPPTVSSCAGGHLSLVATQWTRWIANTQGRQALAAAEFILLGAGAPPPDAGAEAARHGIRLGLSYGLTEAAATVALADPLRRNDNAATPLPHWNVSLGDGDEILLAGSALAEGYWGPDEGGAIGFHATAAPFATGDLGAWTADGCLRILGRRDRMIVSGGEKTHPAEVEAALRATGLVADVAVAGIADPQWGSVPACAFVPADELSPSADELKAALASQLAPWKLPKRWICVNRLPRNAMGKLSHPELEALLAPANPAMETEH